MRSIHDGLRCETLYSDGPLAPLLATDTAVRLTVKGYMPLSVEDIGQSGNRNLLIVIYHYEVQNDDLRRDPEMVFQNHT